MRASSTPQPPDAKNPVRRAAFRRAIPVIAAGVLIVLLAYSVKSASEPRLTQKDVDAAVVRIMASATPPPAMASLVYQAIRPSVVYIRNNAHGAGGDPERSQGTGVVIDQAGLILTALHVVEGADQLEVIFFDGSRSGAEVVTRQPENDIAVIQITEPVELLIPAIMGDPSSLNVGDDAVVVGNPLGIVGSLSSGSISGIGRTFTDIRGTKAITNLIQFDAAVNPGSSGAPLLNRNGEVVGIVVSLANPTDNNVFIGIGFAVPISSAGGALGSPPW